MSETKQPIIEPPYSLDHDEIGIGETITIYAGGGGAPIGTVLNWEDFPCADQFEPDEFHAEVLGTAQLWVDAPAYQSAAIELINRHDTKAQAANFAQCGCADCTPFRAIVAKPTGETGGANGN